MPAQAEGPPISDEAGKTAQQPRWPTHLTTVAIVLLGCCLIAWTVVRIGSGLGRPESAEVTLAVIEWFGWTAISLGSLYLAILLVGAFLTVRRGAARTTILPWIVLLALSGLVFWSFDGIRIAVIGIHAGVLDMAITRDQAFQLSARLYPLSPYIGIQAALMPEPVWAFWHAGRMIAATVLWLLFLAHAAISAIAMVRWRGKDLLSWLLMVPSAAGLGYLILQAVDRPSAYALVAPWLSMNPGPARAEMLVSNFLTAIAATLSLIAGLQIYRLVRLAGLNEAEGVIVREPGPPRATTVFLLACLLIPFADLYGQFDLVLKNREVAVRAELLKDTKKLLIRGPSREVRARPEPDAPVIGTLATGTTVAILESRSGWGRIADGQWVILSDSGPTTASARPTPGTSEALARGDPKTGKRDLAEKLAAGIAVAGGGRVENRPAVSASQAQSSQRGGGSHGPAVNAGEKDSTVKTLHCLGATVERRTHTLRLAVKGEWTEYEKRQQRIAVLKCVRYRGEPFVIIAVAGVRDRRAGIEAYSLDTLDKRFGYLCDREECQETALPFPDDFPLDKR